MNATMLVPPLPIVAVDILCFMHVNLVILDALLRTLAASRGSFATLRAQLKQGQWLPRYGYLVVGVWLVMLVLLMVFQDIPAARLVLRGTLFGVLLLLTVAPWWGLHGLPRYFASAQGLGVLLGVYIWPEAIATLSLRWVFLISTVSYTTLFVATALWHR